MSQWISVKDGLPKPGHRVIGTEGTSAWELYVDQNGRWRRYSGYLWENPKITHWMPFPPPPELEGSNGSD